MGDENTVLDEAAARHLLRRTGFGAPADDVSAFTGLTRGAAADRLLAFTPSGFKPTGRYFENSHDKWIKYMIRTRTPLQEKLVLFWHDHFATGFSTVQSTKFIAFQNRTLRVNCKGSMRDLVKAINIDAAMTEFLNTQQNAKAVPNENYARELMELFTLGVYDFAGNPNYVQDDIVQIARAFTGWRHTNRGGAYLDDFEHDYMAEFPERGSKVIFQSTGGFGSGGRDFADQGEGAAEIDRVVDHIFDHTDTDGQSTVARRTARRLLEYFAHPDPSAAVADAVVAASGFAGSWDIAALLRAIFVHDAFYESIAPAPFAAATKKSVKWPVDYVVGTLRLLGMQLKGRYQYVDGGSYAAILDQLANMGQVLLDPPSVFGWDWETAWISSSTLLARYGFARDVTMSRSGGASGFRPEEFIDLSLTDPGAILDAVADALGVTDQLTADERDALIAYLNDYPGPIDLNDYVYRNTKLHGLFALVLQSPAYQLQ